MVLLPRHCESSHSSYGKFRTAPSDTDQLSHESISTGEFALRSVMTLMTVRWCYTWTTFTWTTTVGDDISWRSAHHLGNVDRCVGLAGQHDGTVHRLRLHLTTASMYSSQQFIIIGSRLWGYKNRPIPYPGRMSQKAAKPRLCSFMFVSAINNFLCLLFCVSGASVDLFLCFQSSVAVQLIACPCLERLVSKIIYYVSSELLHSTD